MQIKLTKDRLRGGKSIQILFLILHIWSFHRKLKTQRSGLTWGLMCHFNKRHYIVEKSQNKEEGASRGSRLWEGKYMGKPTADRVVL